GMTASDMDLFIPHQANLRIIEAAVKRLNLPWNKVFVNIEKYGNTSAAAIPIALCEAIDQGRITPGAHIGMVAFGAGLTWAAAVVKWTASLDALHNTIKVIDETKARLEAEAEPANI